MESLQTVLYLLKKTEFIWDFLLKMFLKKERNEEKKILWLNIVKLWRLVELLLREKLHLFAREKKHMYLTVCAVCLLNKMRKMPHTHSSARTHAHTPVIKLQFIMGILIVKHFSWSRILSFAYSRQVYEWRLLLFVTI